MLPAPAVTLLPEADCTLPPPASETDAAVRLNVPPVVMLPAFMKLDVDPLMLPPKFKAVPAAKTAVGEERFSVDVEPVPVSVVPLFGTEILPADAVNVVGPTNV